MSKLGRLQIKTAEGRDGQVVVTMTAPNGRDYELSMSIFEVSTLVSALYVARSEALKHPDPQAPEGVLRMQGMKVGEEERHVLMRVFVTDHLYQDFGAEKGTPLAQVLERIGEDLANALQQAPEEFGGPGRTH